MFFSPATKLCKHVTAVSLIRVLVGVVRVFWDMAWQQVGVGREGRGLSLGLESHHEGMWRK